MDAENNHKAPQEKINALEKDAAAREKAETLLKKQSAFLNLVTDLDKNGSTTALHFASVEKHITSRYHTSLPESQPLLNPFRFPAPWC